MIFAMISTAKSASYTTPAVESFFRTTPLADGDRFILIENDGLEPGLARPSPRTPHVHGDFPRMETIQNDAPKSFSANVNQALRLALSAETDAMVLNNDIIFAQGWFECLPKPDDAITLPYCNQQAQYTHRALKLEYSMDWEQFRGDYRALDVIASQHRACHEAPPAPPFAKGSGRHPLARERLIPFYCFRLPYKILAQVGLFDEALVNGGEDVDYRIRTLLAGFDVAFGAHSYVLHFGGKSTWRGTETPEETSARDRAYRTRFVEKWGAEMADVLLANDAKAAETLERLSALDAMRAGDFLSVVKVCQTAARARE